jgi:hypothetical protein
MANLTISASFGLLENRISKEATVEEPVSQKVLSVFFGFSPEDLEKVALEHHITQEIKYKGPDNRPAIFYKVESIPALLSGLQEEIKKSHSFGDKKWLESLDTTQKTFEFQIPSGSIFTFTKD